MSSRAEEKERRRQERLAAEEAAQSGARRKRFGIVGGVVLLAAIAVIAVLAIASGGDEGEVTRGVALPEERTDNLNEAARAAGCRVRTDPVDSGDHVSETVRYSMAPPTSGDHDPSAAQDGIYEAGNPPDIEQSVHSLEHGRINFQYRPGTPPARVDQLETLFSESVKGEDGYHSLLFENPGEMDAAVAATAWGRALVCPQFNDRVFDALRAFRRDRVDKGPEFVP